MGADTQRENMDAHNETASPDDGSAPADGENPESRTSSDVPEGSTSHEGVQTPTDGAAREAKALEELADRLNKEYAHSEQSVASAIDKALARFHGHAVRDFVPILVERIARRELEGKPEESVAESTSSPADTGTAAADAIEPEPTTPDTSDPDTEDTAATDPDTTETATTTSDTSTPTATDTPTTDPDTSDPDTNATAIAHPGTNDPDTSDIAAIDPDAGGPNTSETTTTTPTTTETAATEPDTSDPNMSTPGTTDPGNSDPGNTSPEPTAIADRLRSGARNLVRGPLTGAHILVSALVAIVLILLFVHPHTTGKSNENNTATSTSVVTVHGVVGSEKLAYFGDPKVIDALARHGLRVQVEPAGSRQIATSVNLGKYDFAFPSSEPAAETILRERNLTTKYTPFSSPMAIATFKPIVDLLTAAGVVRPGPVPTLDMNRYLQLVDTGTQWNQLPGNTTYPVPKNILVSTTDPRTSNSADMYVAIASYVANDNTIVRGPVAEANAVDKIAKLFVGQGYSDNSSAGPFDQYLSAGMGPTPMVLIYEAQYVEAAVAGRITPDMELLYPSPTVLSRHTLVPLDPAGDRLGRLLTSDPELQALAAQHGFRTDDPAQFTKVTTQHNVPVTPQVTDVVDAPAYDTLQHLLDGVSKAYS